MSVFIEKFEAKGFSRQQIASMISPRVQELIILPTEKCNFRCTYCYEDFAIGRMSPATQTAIERFVARRAEGGMKWLRLKWFGGEPLLARDVVLRLSRFAHDLSRTAGFEVMGDMTTNAFLLDRALFEELVLLNLNFFQVTLDGWGEAHDAVRKKANGGGTFAGIWKNLVAMRTVPHAFEILIRVHIRRENIAGLPTLMRHLAEHFGDDPRFRLDFEHVRDLGGGGGKTIADPVSFREARGIEQTLRAVYREAVARTFPALVPPMSAAAAADAEDAAAEVLRKAKAAGESAGGRRAGDITADEPYICYAAKPNSLLIRANGRIGKCTVAFADDRNDIGHIAEDGSVDIDNKKVLPWIRGLSTFEPAMLSCPLVGMGSPEAPSPA